MPDEIQYFVSQPFGDGGSNSGHDDSERLDYGFELGPFSFVAGHIESNPSSVSIEQSNMVISSSPTPAQNHQVSNLFGNRWLMEQQQRQSVPHFHQGQHVAQHFSFSQGQDEQNKPQQKNEPMFLQQQEQHQQQYQQNHISMQTSQATTAQMNLFQQKQTMLMQQQQMIALQKCLLQEQVHHQNPALRSAPGAFNVPGTCARRLTLYMYLQQHRPRDNNIGFWRKFVTEFFAPHAKKRLCFSIYRNNPQSCSSFSQGMWHCRICNMKPGYGYEVPAEVLPRLFKVKYDSGIVRELLYVDMPHEYQKPSGEIVLHYEKAVEETVFEKLRIVRDGHLCLVFTPDLKICSWEFCARCIEHFIPQRSIIPQVKQLGVVAQKYQLAAQNASANSPSEELNSYFNMFVASACEFSKGLELPFVNDIGYTKPHVRCLEMSQVLNRMEHLIDHSIKSGMSPKTTFAKLYGSITPSGWPNSGHQPDGKQQRQPFAQQEQTSYHNSAPETSVQFSTSNGVTNVNNNQTNCPSSPYAYSPPSQIPSVGSSSMPRTAQMKISSPFSAPTPSSSPNNPPQTCQKLSKGLVVVEPHIGSEYALANVPVQQSSQSNETDQNESQSTGDKFIQTVSSDFLEVGNMVGSGAIGNNGTTEQGCSIGDGTDGGDFLAANEMVNNSPGISVSVSLGGSEAAVGNDSATIDLEVSMPLMPQDTSINNQQL